MQEQQSPHSLPTSLILSNKTSIRKCISLVQAAAAPYRHLAISFFPLQGGGHLTLADACTDLNRGQHPMRVTTNWLLAHPQKRGHQSRRWEKNGSLLGARLARMGAVVFGGHEALGHFYPSNAPITVNRGPGRLKTMNYSPV